MLLASCLICSAGLGRSVHNESPSLPRLEALNDDKEILEAYPAYLTFVYQMGQSLDKEYSEKFKDSYLKLYDTETRLAARFLKGVRYEILQYLQTRNLSLEEASLKNRRFSKWLTRYLRVWVREADELRFRSMAVNRND